VIFDGVSFLGDASPNQVGVLLSAPRVRIETEDVLYAQIQYGIVVHRGALATSSTTFFGADASAVYAETTTRQASLRIGDSSFIDCEVPIQIGSGASTVNLREFRVTCSQFLFNRRVNPIVATDCIKQPALCAEALKYNTIITDIGGDDDAPGADKMPLSPAVRAERRMLRQGANHLESARDRTQFIYFGSENEFSLRDSQGRLSSVTGVLNGGNAERAFLLATYAPLREECMPFDGTQFGSTSSIVSSVLEVRSDALLHECATLSASFHIANTTLLPALVDLGVYGVTHLGSNPVWTRERARIRTSLGSSDNNAIIETTVSVHDENDRHDHRIVVVSHATLPEAMALALASESATTNDQQRIVGRSLCVACNAGVDIPAYLLDSHCSGNSDNIRSSFDAAYDELGFGTSKAPRQEAVSLFVYGTCKTRKCTLLIDQNEIIEGASMIVRGALVRAADLTTCTAADALIKFTERSSKAAIRYMTLDGSSSVGASASCAIEVVASTALAIAGPTIAYSTIRGTLCVDSRAGGSYIGNDIFAQDVAVFFDLKSVPTKKHNDQPIIFEANRIMFGNVQVDGLLTPIASDKAPRWDLRMDRNTFGSLRCGFVVIGEGVAATMSNNKQVGLLINDNATSTRFTAVNTEMAEGGHIDLQQRALVSFVTNSVALNCSVTLADTVHLGDVAFDADSVVVIHPSASVVLRQILFEDVARTLTTYIVPEICALSEKSTTGIDVLRSTIFNAHGDRIFTQQQLMAVLASDAKDYFNVDGEFASCANDGVRVREETRCGCPESLDVATPIATSAIIVEDETVVAETATNDVNVVDELTQLEISLTETATTAAAAAAIETNADVIDIVEAIEERPQEIMSAEDWWRANKPAIDETIVISEARHRDDANNNNNNNLSDLSDGASDGSDFDIPEELLDGSDREHSDRESGDGHHNHEDEKTSLLWLFVFIPVLCILICGCVLLFTRWRGAAYTQQTIAMSERANVRLPPPISSGKQQQQGSYRPDATLAALDVSDMVPRIDLNKPAISMVALSSAASSSSSSSSSSESGKNKLIQRRGKVGGAGKAAAVAGSGKTEQY